MLALFLAMPVAQAQMSKVKTVFVSKIGITSNFVIHSTKN